MRKLQCFLQLIEDVEREKGDLPFVVLPIIEKAVPSQSSASHAFHLLELLYGMAAGGLTVVPKELVPRGNE